MTPFANHEEAVFHPAFRETQFSARFTDTQLDLARAVYSNVQEGVLITDSAGNMVAVNPALVRISEYSERELLGRNIRLFRSRRHSAQFYARVWEQLRSDGTWQGEIWNRRRSGEVFPQWLRVASVANPDGDCLFYVWVVVDVSRMNHAHSQL